MSESSSKLLATLFAENRVYSVRELNERIRDVLELEFFAVHVQGEVSNFKRHTSGHWYFTLKDADAQLRGVFFKQWNRLLRFEPRNGLEVRVRGRINVYEPRGEYQIVVETMEPVGVGTLQLAFEQQVNRLSAEGLFDESRKRSLVAFPHCVGIVTSPVGAALHDVLQILERRNPAVNVLFVPVRVQGNGAAGEIADAIRLLNKYSKQNGAAVDTIIIGRGGGSMEDLWAFNEEQVARAIFNSEIPVVSAIGHETDFTIADFVADLRAPTPSAAAELVAADTGRLFNQVAELQQQLARAFDYYLLCRRKRLRNLTESRAFQRTAQMVLSLSQRCRELEARSLTALNERLRLRQWYLSDLQRRLSSTDFRAPIRANQIQLDTLTQRLERSIQKRLERKGGQLAVTASKLDALSPLAVLGRGYALVKDQEGKLVTQATFTSRGQILKIRFEDGETNCQVI
jgi:exodeoxyribonuclease VII large subunit